MEETTKKLMCWAYCESDNISLEEAVNKDLSLCSYVKVISQSQGTQRIGINSSEETEEEMITLTLMVEVIWKQEENIKK